MQDFWKLGPGQEQNRFRTLFDKIDGMTTVDALTQYIGGKSKIKNLAWEFAHFGDAAMN